MSSSTHSDELKESRAEVRALKQKQAVLEDTLGELRAETVPLRRCLKDLWQLVKDKRVRVPDELRKECNALIYADADSHDRQPKYKGTTTASSEQRPPVTILVHDDKGKTARLDDNAATAGNSGNHDNNMEVAAATKVASSADDQLPVGKDLAKWLKRPTPAQKRKASDDIEGVAVYAEYAKKIKAVEARWEAE